MPRQFSPVGASVGHCDPGLLESHTGPLKAENAGISEPTTTSVVRLGDSFCTEVCYSRASMTTEGSATSAAGYTRLSPPPNSVWPRRLRAKSESLNSGGMLT
jgi:hypothetical protein